jgi:mono/diheme cytochrome c family protein
MRNLLFLTALAAPALFAEDFPKGEGRDLTMEKCAGCHALDQVAAHRDTPQGWDGVVQYMVSRGMVATEEEVKTIHKYLSEQFPKEETKGKAKGKAK